MYKQSILFLLLIIVVATTTIKAQSTDSPDPNRYLPQIEEFRNWDTKNSFPEDAVLFVGSSSIVLWPTAEAFPNYKVINRGFGGSHLSDIYAFYDDVIRPYNPSLMVLYAGENDVTYGTPITQVVDKYKKIAEKFLQETTDSKILFLSLKPSSSRWEHWPGKIEVNQAIEQYNQGDERLFFIDVSTPLLNSENRPDDLFFVEDLLHLSDEGYRVWNKIVMDELNSLFDH